MPWYLVKQDSFYLYCQRQMMYINKYWILKSYSVKALMLSIWNMKQE